MTLKHRSNMNTLRFFLAAALALLVVPLASAQNFIRYTHSAIMSGGTNNVAATATNTYNGNSGIMTVTLQEYLPIQVSYNFHTAPVGATPSVTLRLQRSIDSSNWESNAPIHVLLANGATNTTVWVTNITAGGVGYFRINTIENTNSAVITNVTVKYGIKR